MKIATSFILIFCIFFGTQSTCAQNADVDSINIISQWGGLGKPSRHYLFLKEKKGRLYKGRKRINAKLIETIFGELNPVAKLRLSDFGIDQEWLTANAKEANMYSFLYSDEQNSLFYKSFTDTELIKSIFPSLFRCYWSDDSPYLKMEIIKKDKSKIILSTNSKCQFMLPFTISVKGKEHISYNPNLSKAIVAILPKRFTNKNRLGGKHLLEKLGEAVSRKIRRKMRDLEK